MRHFGDITKLNGSELPVVDCITGGSPCQDLSIAGARAGLAGERSGLFMEQVRIVKEMREHDRRAGRAGQFIRPRFHVWENVPGAFSSNKGADFGAVLTEIIRVAEPQAPDVLMPEKGWPNAGCIYSALGEWSVAWRVHDAQFWGATQYSDGRVLIPGTPQRRRRIALVADYGGLSAPEVLFERKGLSWDTEAGGEAGQGSARGPVSSASETISFQERGGKPGGGKGILIQKEHVGALSTLNNQSVLAFGEVAGTLDASYYKGCGMRQGVERDVVIEPRVYDARGNGDGDVAPTLAGDHQNRVTDYTAVCIGNGQTDQLRISDKVGTLNCMHDQQAVITYGLDRASFNQGQNAQYDFSVLEETEPTLTAKGPAAVGHSVVRRLTPMECERLQGYPDGWTDIGRWAETNGKMHKESSDSARYKALGNSLCLPFWFWLSRRISAQYERPATLGSLFDGIGGFPLVWERCNGKGTALWASEIDEFCAQYDKGYSDGRFDRDREIVRCKDCKHYQKLLPEDADDDKRCVITELYDWKPPMWYCADGERKDEVEE